jgi:hypothetical protein
MDKRLQRKASKQRNEQRRLGRGHQSRIAIMRKQLEDVAAGDPRGLCADDWLRTMYEGGGAAQVKDIVTDVLNTPSGQALFADPLSPMRVMLSSAVSAITRAAADESLAAMRDLHATDVPELVYNRACGTWLHYAGRSMVFSEPNVPIAELEADLRMVPLASSMTKNVAGFITMPDGSIALWSWGPVPTVETTSSLGFTHILDHAPGLMAFAPVQGLVVITCRGDQHDTRVDSVRLIPVSDRVRHGSAHAFVCAGSPSVIAAMAVIAAVTAPGYKSRQ